MEERVANPSFMAPRSAFVNQRTASGKCWTKEPIAIIERIDEKFHRVSYVRCQSQLKLKPNLNRISTVLPTNEYRIDFIKD